MNVRKKAEIGGFCEYKVPESNTINAPHARVHAVCMHAHGILGACACFSPVLVGLPRPPPMVTPLSHSGLRTRWALSYLSSTMDSVCTMDQKEIPEPN